MFVDGVEDTALRSQLAAFLTALGLATPAAKGGEQGAPRGFRCRRGGGGVLQGVAALMDERDLAGPPSLDREAAFDAAKEVSKRALNGLRCSRCRSQIKKQEFLFLAAFFVTFGSKFQRRTSFFFGMAVPHRLVSRLSMSRGWRRGHSRLGGILVLFCGGGCDRWCK